MRRNRLALWPSDTGACSIFLTLPWEFSVPSGQSFASALHRKQRARNESGREGDAEGPATVSPLRALIPDYVAPERLYLEARWASLVPYAAAAGLLADVLPITSGANATTLREHTVRSTHDYEPDKFNDTILTR
jgi:hypothetical protein